MKFTASNLQGAIHHMRSAVGNERTLPILAHVLIETGQDSITITAGDLQTELKITAPADIQTPGKCCLNAHHLATFTKNAGEFPLTVECKNTTAVLKAKGRSKINTLPADDYPSMPDKTDSETTTLTLDAEFLANAIGMIEHCAARTDVRYCLNGILLQNQGATITLTASDGHRLGAIQLDAIDNAGQNQHCIIPIKSALLIAKLFKTGNITLSYSRDRIRVDNMQTVVTCKVIDGKFPDFSKPFAVDKPLQTEIDSEQFAACIETASITATKPGYGMTITLSSDTLSAHASNVDGEESSDTVPCTHDGDPYSIAFNAKYLLESATHISGMMYLNSDGEKMLTLQPRSRRVTYLIMGMRL